MADQIVRLKGKLDSVDVVFGRRGVVTARVGDTNLICEMTRFGLICEDPHPLPGSGGGRGPVIQLRMTAKLLQARALDDPDDEAELQSAKGFQRHRI